MRGNYSISSVHKNEKNPPKVYILIKYNHCVLLTHPLVRIELFFLCYGYSIFKKRRGGRHFYPSTIFSKYLTTPTIFSDPLPLFTTRPLLITPYHFPDILTLYLFRGPPYHCTSDDPYHFPKFRPPTSFVDPSTTSDDPLTFSQILTPYHFLWPPNKKVM